MPLAESKWVQPEGIPVSAYRLGRLRDEAILKAFHLLEERGELFLYLKSNTIDGKLEIIAEVKDRLSD